MNTDRCSSVVSFFAVYADENPGQVPKNFRRSIGLFVVYHWSFVLDHFEFGRDPEASRHRPLRFKQFKNLELRTPAFSLDLPKRTSINSARLKMRNSGILTDLSTAPYDFLLR